MGKSIFQEGFFKMSADVSVFVTLEERNLPRRLAFVDLGDVMEIHQKRTMGLYDIRTPQIFFYLIKRKREYILSVFGMYDGLFQYNFYKEDILVRNGKNALCGINAKAGVLQEPCFMVDLLIITQEPDQFLLTFFCQWYNAELTAVPFPESPKQMFQP